MSRGEVDWFERLVGFREQGYAQTRQKLFVDDVWRLHSRVNGAAWGIGRFETPSLAELRSRVQPAPGHLRLAIVRGDARALHAAPESAGALFQVASQFNALEMPHPSVTPEQGVAGYAHDHTQGPACAMACGAATIYRNYFVPCAGGSGQTRERQIDGLAELGGELARLTGTPVTSLWQMRNGYALATAGGLHAIRGVLGERGEEALDALRAKLRIAVHLGAEVTDVESPPRPVVSQAFCSALPVAYTSVAAKDWEPFARVVLDAAYEATLLVAAENARKGGSNIALLTLLGGGVFGNPEEWIVEAMRRALSLASNWDLDVRIVCHAPPTPMVEALAESFP